MPLSTIDNTGLSQSQILSAINMPTGSVIQTVNFYTTTVASTTGGTLVPSNITASITPLFSTSKILVTIATACYKTAGNSATDLNLYLYKNGSSLIQLNIDYGNNSVNGNQFYGFNTTYLDSPATTSSTTYTLYFANGNSTGNGVYIGYSSGNQTMILQEIR